MRVRPETLTKLQSDPKSVRNICILAHVDHGKTSLSDGLLASNGIISQKLAGKVRYLDSRPDEQLRGITMESSAISLYFRVLHKQQNAPDIVDEHLINLIDSPGHIDFSSEVSTASRLCDGAVVLVDVVEGVCSQTVTVLRQAWIEKITPILVLNKIDRLYNELKLTPYEAYIHLSKTIEQVNSVLGSFFAGQRMEDDLLWRELREKGDENAFQERDDEDIYFSPEKNNVIFASAYDGWGFSISQFASFYEKKLGMKREILQKVLWGNYYYDHKNKKVLTSKNLKKRNLKIIFVQFILENIWKIYEHCLTEKNIEKLEMVVKTLNLRVTPRELKSKDNRALLTTIFGQWLPVSTAVLLTIVQKLPSPLVAQKERIPVILNSAPGSDKLDETLKKAMIECDKSGPTAAYVSKMVSVPESELPKIQQSDALTHEDILERSRKVREAARKAAEKEKQLKEEEEKKDGQSNTYNPFAEYYENNESDDDDNDEPEEEEEIEKEALIGFARIYSGTLSVGQELTVLGPKYDPTKPNEHISRVTLTDLYLMMGRELVPLEHVPAGNIVGIGGLAGKILKNGTLVSVGYTGVNLAGLALTSPPIVRVALEPVNPTQMNRLEKGLEMLNQSDPCVQTFLQDTGEHILLAAGELHLERCLKDLRERFAKIEIQSSEPVIPYRETIVNASEMNPPKNSELGRGIVEVTVGKFVIKFGINPLPNDVSAYLIENQSTIAKITKLRSNKNIEETFEIENDVGTLDNEGAGSNPTINTKLFKTQLSELFSKNSQKNEIWGENITDRISKFGSKAVGPNILFDSSIKFLHRIFDHQTEVGSKHPLASYESSIQQGFQLATLEGPLAHEPMQGVAVFLLSITSKDGDNVDTELPPNISGRLITETRNAIYNGFKDWSPRIMLAMYSCDIQTYTEALGKVYAVVTRRRGKIVSEEMKEGTPFFAVEARIPVVEAFGFAEDIRKKTSGAASPQLIFAGFEIVDEDPFWVPTTEEELEKLGEFAERENIARKYVDAIRKRKVSHHLILFFSFKMFTNN